MRLRSTSSLLIGSIPLIRSESTVTARLRAHAVPIGVTADSKIRLEREWVSCGPEILHCVVDSSLSLAALQISHRPFSRTNSHPGTRNYMYVRT